MTIPVDPTIAMLSAKLPNLSLVELGAIFAKCMDESSQFSSTARSPLKCNIEREWVRRHTVTEFQASHNVSLPSPGMLKAVGHCVGHNGQDEQLRRNLLDYLFETKILPPVKDVAHESEWGNSGSWKRLNKINRVLTSLISEHRDKPSHSKAVSEWQLDSEYCYRTHIVRVPGFKELLRRVSNDNYQV